MHLKDLDIDIPYRTTNATYSKGSSMLLVKGMKFIVVFKMSVSIFGVNSYYHKEEY